MTLKVPNINDFIERIGDTLAASTLLFPQSVGGDESATDIVNQIIKYELPIPEATIEGPGPPHVFIKESFTPYIQKKQIGRNDLSVQGPEEHIMEFYIIVVAQGNSYKESQIQIANITQAIVTILKSNLQLADKDGKNHLCNILETIVVPYLIDTDQRDVIAKNIVVRPKVFVNLRT